MTNAEPSAARLRELEVKVAALESELAELRTTFQTFSAQFET